jgi:formylglycine-generating enzyme required for sulfatase activity
MNTPPRVYNCPRDQHTPLRKFELCPECHLWPVIPTWSVIVVLVAMIAIPLGILVTEIFQNIPNTELAAQSTEMQIVENMIKPTIARLPGGALVPESGLAGASAGFTPTPNPMPGVTFTPNVTPTFALTASPSATPPPAATLPPKPAAFQPGVCSKDGAAIPSSMDGMILLCVTQGSFRMGSDPAVDANAVSDEFPMHTVSLKAFWIDQTEVTNRQYALCVKAGGCSGPVSENSKDPVYFGNPAYDNYPVTYIDWDQANSYCMWANRRLPSEAEWEKAARGTKASIYPWGNTAPNADLLNYKLNKGGIMPVGSYPKGKSFYGALDMAGNVMEWVGDTYLNSYYASQDVWNNPQGPATGSYGVTKGGAWISHGDYRVRSAARYGYDRKTRLGANGFRCAVDGGK